MKRNNTPPGAAGINRHAALRPPPRPRAVAAPWVVLVLLVLTGVHGCHEEDEYQPPPPKARMGETCKADADCRSGKCTAAKCVCVADFDCSAHGGERCINEVCLTSCDMLPFKGATVSIEAPSVVIPDKEIKVTARVNFPPGVSDRPVWEYVSLELVADPAQAKPTSPAKMVKIEPYFTKDLVRVFNVNPGGPSATGPSRPTAVVRFPYKGKNGSCTLTGRAVWLVPGLHTPSAIKATSQNLGGSKFKLDIAVSLQGKPLAAKPVRIGCKDCLFENTWPYTKDQVTLTTDAAGKASVTFSYDCPCRQGSNGGDVTAAIQVPRDTDVAPGTFDEVKVGLFSKTGNCQITKDACACVRPSERFSDGRLYCQVCGPCTTGGLCSSDSQCVAGARCNGNRCYEAGKLGYCTKSRTCGNKEGLCKADEQCTFPGLCNFDAVKSGFYIGAPCTTGFVRGYDCGGKEVYKKWVAMGDRSDHSWDCLAWCKANAPTSTCAKYQQQGPSLSTSLCRCYDGTPWWHGLKDPGSDTLVRKVVHD